MDSFEISSNSYDPRALRDDRGVRSAHTAPQAEQPQTHTQHTTSRQEPQSRTAAKTSSAEKQAAAAPQGRWRLFFGIVMILAAVYMLIVSISFFSNGADDQSIVQGAQYSSVADASARVGNTGGPVGAMLSDLLMSRWLGIGSFIIIFYIGAVGVSLVKLHHFRFWDLTYKCLLSAIVLSILTGFVTYGLTSYNHWGGNHGHVINEVLMEHSGIWGAIAVNILLVSAVVLVFLKEIQTAYNAYRTRIEAHRRKLEKERAEAEARRKIAESKLSPEPMQTPDEPAAVETAEEHQADTGNIESIPEPERREAMRAPSEPVVTKVVEMPPAEVMEPSPLDTIDDVDSPEQPDTMEEENSNTDDNQTVSPEENPEQEQDENEDNTTPNEVTMTVNIPAATVEATNIPDELYDPTAELSRYRMPSIDLFKKREQLANPVDIEEQEENKERLTKTLSTYGVALSHIEATVGPTITRYEVIPAEGQRIRSIRALGDDLALSLSALGIRIIAPIPGKGTIGIEVPNKKPQIVDMKEIISSEKFQNSDYELPIAMGRTISNEIYVADLAKLPHLLVAGATGMGKSVGLNAIIASLLYKKHPAELKFVLIDPKRVELSLYRKLERHYLAALPGEDPIITDTSKVVAVLNSLCVEMGNRLSLLEEAGVRNIKEYNEKFIARRLNPQKHRFLPYIVLIIDEFADIILTAGKEVESPVSRLAAVARAAGIHLILATQRPAVNVITGGIKTNIPGRIAFRTIQSVDSRTILDRTGAEQLVGKGDMIFSRDGVLDRVQCGFIDTEEVKAICDHVSEQIGYDEPYELPEFCPAGPDGGGASGRGGTLTDRDPLFVESARLVIDSNLGSASNLQRKFNIGYPRAGKIMDQLETAGIVGPPQGGKPRQVLMDMYAFEEYLNSTGTNK